MLTLTGRPSCASSRAISSWSSHLLCGLRSIFFSAAADGWAWNSSMV